MAKPRAILNRAKSIRSIARITNTMRMIASARFQKAFARAIAARPYTDRLGKLLRDLAAAAGDFAHPLLDAREERRVTVLGIASNRGLCGGYNANVGREVVRLDEELDGRGLEHEIHVAGRRLATMARYAGVHLASVLSHLDDRPSFAQIDAITTPFLAAYEAGEVDGLYVVYTKFVSASRQRVVTERVLPLRSAGGDTGEEGAAPAAEKDYIFSPDPATILSDLLPRSVRLKVFQAFLDASVSEQTARMVAMKAATDNANDLIVSLTRKYNRSRQAQITTELSEIMGGAAALE